MTSLKQLTDEEAGLCTIENAELAKSILGQSEEQQAQSKLYDEELFNDLVDETKVKANKVDDKKILNQVIEIQEKMTKISNLRSKTYGKDWDIFNKCKTAWWNLKNQCDSVVGGRKYIWKQYFQLRDKAVSRFFTSYNSKDFDEQKHLNDSQNDTADILRDEHIKEMLKRIGNTK